MTPPVIALIAIVLGPLVLLMFLRVNAALVFLSLCLGDVLVQFVASDAGNFLTLHADQVPQQAANAGNDTIKLVLLLLPVVLTTIFMIRTIRGNFRLILNFLPAAGVGLLGALLVVPLLPSGLSHNIVDSSLWSQAQRAQDLIVGGSALVCMFVLWLQRPKSGTGHKHGKH
ncbi:MAG TPA: hypothetical protein VMU97_02730 [Candidatus Dormibacteraeota bacterium]|nr:hypothetical protein [Candidatus Dormibacteraeota bacterium]